MKITMYVDVVSPFAYIAYHVLRHDPVFKHCEITYVPIFLGGLMKMTGNTPPIEVKNKDVWINAERLRWARYFGVPMLAGLPPAFPARTLTVMRAVCALAGPQQQQDALDALFDAYWVRGRAIDDAAAELGVQAADEQAAAEGKRLLLANTERAFADGAFGLPWLVCENDGGQREGFWGVDHLGCVLDFLGLEKPGPGGAWKAML